MLSLESPKEIQVNMLVYSNFDPTNIQAQFFCLDSIQKMMS